MIPLKLTIEGLYSYRSRQTIDFSNLTRSGLFGIFGGVGSGKSSILEAISFALFGECERLNTRDSRNYNMMNLKSNELLIDFEFKTHQEEVYRFLVQGKRNRKKFDDVKTFDRTAYHSINGAWIPVSVDDAETITGLNYKNFRRTIIIPQGKFQEFLQLSPGDRTTMLKELFNLSKYELSEKISRIEGKNDASIQYLSGRLTEIGEVDPGQITILEAGNTQMAADIVTFRNELSEKEKSDHLAEELKKLSENIAAQKKILSGLRQSEPGVKELERSLKEHELFDRIFKADIAQLANLTNRFATSDKQLGDHRKKLEELQGEAALVQAGLNAMKNDYDKREQLLRESEELGKLASVKESEKELAAHMASATAIKLKQAEISELLASLKKRQSDSTVELDDLRQNLPDFRTLSLVKTWFTEKLRIIKSQGEIQKKMAEQERQLKSLGEQMMINLAGSQLIDDVPETPEIKQVLGLIEASRMKTEERSKEISAIVSDLEIRKKLEDFAADLHDGKPCPLCGSVNHPEVLNPTDVAKELNMARGEFKGLNDRLKKCNDLEKYLAASQTREESIRQTTKSLENESGQLKDSLNEHLEQFIWNDFENNGEEKVKAEEIRYDQVKNAVETKEKGLKTIGDAIGKNGQLLEKQTEALNEINHKIIAARTKIELLQKQITALDPEPLNVLSPGQLLEKSAELIKKHNILTQDYTHATNKQNTLQSAISGHSGKISEMEKNHRDLQDQIHQLDQKIETSRRENGQPEVEHILAVLKKEMNIEQERLTIENFYREVETIGRFLADLELKLDGRLYDEEAHNLLKKNVLELKQTVEAMNKTMVEHEMEIKILRKKIKDYTLVSSDKKKAELRKQDISELKNLFRSSGFVNYVSTVYLQNLCQSANERFYKLTRQKQGLELADDNSFLVRDYMNDGHLRSVKTLSGGQTFQASLSLALSLADSIHKLAGSSENFFFLDEGFGTLDKETLEIAFETLKSLRKENRIVGVISHVEEMQAEIETYLKVTNDEEHGSVVKGSWEGRGDAGFT